MTAIPEGNFRLLLPNQALPFTGERMTTAVGGQIEFEHFHRYCLARDLCAGRDVLDLASGEGYGAAMLAGTAKSVVGVEIDAGAVTHARTAYVLPNLHFEQGSAEAIPLQDACVDLVVSFETIEHLDDPPAFLAEVRRVLRPGGALVASTPDRRVYSAAAAAVNTFHRLEYTFEEFSAELARHFANVALFWQRPVLGSAIIPASTSGSTARTYERRATDIIEASTGLARAPYLIAVASDAVLPAVGPSHYLAQQGTAEVQVELARLREVDRAWTGHVAHLECVLAERTAERDASRRAHEASTVRDGAELVRLHAASRAWADQVAHVEHILSERTAERDGYKAAQETVAAQLDIVDAVLVGRTAERDRLEAAQVALSALLDAAEATAAGLPALEARLADTERALAELQGTQTHQELATARAALAKAEDELSLWIGGAAQRDAEYAVMREQLMHHGGDPNAPWAHAHAQLQSAQAELASLRATAATLAQDLAAATAARDAAHHDADAARRRATTDRAAAGLAQAQAQRLETRALQDARLYLGRQDRPRRLRRALGLAPPPPSTTALPGQADRLARFLGRFDPAPLLAPGPEGRPERILRFLVGAPDGIADLPLFSSAAYLAMHPDASGSPLLHYIDTGAAQGLSLHPLIDTRWYHDRHPDAAALDMPAALHFATWGADKGYDPHPLFDVRTYQRQYPDVAQARLNPLAHYLRHPGCRPHPLFDSAFYMDRYPDVVASGTNPLVHYVLNGGREGRDPCPAFDGRFYLDTNPDVAAAGLNPLIHYIEHGASEGREPHPSFSGAAYRARYPDVVAIGMNPLAHYVQSGMAEGRDASPLPPAPARPGKPRLLVVDAAYPEPDRDAGSLYEVALIRIFQALGYDVHFAADVGFGAASPYRDGLEAMGVACMGPPYASVDDLIARTGQGYALFMLTRFNFGARYINAVRRAAPAARIVFNTVDLHFLREEREARLTGNAAALAQAGRTRRQEIAAAMQADATFVVSEQEEVLLGQAAPGAHVVMMPLLQEEGLGRDGGFVGRSGLGFIGGYRHAPNVDAVTFFLDQVWPLVRARLPGATFHVIGPDLPDAIASRTDPGVEFVGHVPDLAPWFARLRMTVAPLRFGAGAKGKVVGSLARGVPCVASPVAAEGMGLTDGQDILVGADPEALADRIVLLDTDEARWTQLSDAGMALIERRYSRQYGEALMRGVLSDIGAPVIEAGDDAR